MTPVHSGCLALLPPMPPGPRLVIMLLAGAMGLLYLLAGLLGVHALMRRRRPPTKRASRWLRWGRMVILSLAGMGLLCTLYAYLIEPRWLEVTHVRLTSAKFAQGQGPVRIVHISDLHCEVQAGLEEELPEVIARLNPDLIVFTGDAANSPAGIPNFQRCMARLVGIAPTFTVPGNWDERPGLEHLFNVPGLHDIQNRVVSINIRGAELWLSGTPQPSAEDWKIPPGAFLVVLYHAPDQILLACRHHADLYCTGHTHGGQVALPFLGGLAYHPQSGPRYERGLHRVGDTWLYVNRGIGMEGRGAPRVRFGARPEVTVIDLAPEP